MVVMPGVVLLHAKPDYGVNRLGISLSTLKTPVEFGHDKNDPVDIVVVVLSSVGGAATLERFVGSRGDIAAERNTQEDQASQER